MTSSHRWLLVIFLPVIDPGLLIGFGEFEFDEEAGELDRAV